MKKYILSITTVLFILTIWFLALMMNGGSMPAINIFKQIYSLFAGVIFGLSFGLGLPVWLSSIVTILFFALIWWAISKIVKKVYSLLIKE